MASFFQRKDAKNGGGPLKEWGGAEKQRTHATICFFLPPEKTEAICQVVKSILFKSKKGKRNISSNWKLMGVSCFRGPQAAANVFGRRMRQTGDVESSSSSFLVVGGGVDRVPCESAEVMPRSKERVEFIEF